VNDPVDRLLDERQAMDRGLPGGMLISLFAHLMLVGAAGGAQRRTPPCTFGRAGPQPRAAAEGDQAAEAGAAPWTARAGRAQGQGAAGANSAGPFGVYFL